MKLPKFEGKVECPNCGTLADVTGDFDGRMLSVVGSATAHFNLRIVNAVVTCSVCGFSWSSPEEPK